MKTCLRLGRDFCGNANYLAGISRDRFVRFYVAPEHVLRDCCAVPSTAAAVQIRKRQMSNRAALAPGGGRRMSSSVRAQFAGASRRCGTRGAWQRGNLAAWRAARDEERSAWDAAQLAGSVHAAMGESATHGRSARLGAAPRHRNHR